MLWKADFHIHSCLSPCGSLSSSPDAILEAAKSAGLNLIALTDHNTAKNCPAFQTHAERMGFSVLYGIEVNTQEEAHCLALFDRLERAMKLDEWVTSLLPDIPNDPDKMGDQVIVNPENEIIGTIDTYLGAASEITLSELLEWTHRHGGLCIPSHIDRMYNSLSAQLGFVPDEAFDALEWSARGYAKREKNPVFGAERYCVISNSDSHDTEMIGTVWNEFETEEEVITIETIGKCLKKREWTVCFGRS